MFSLEQLINKAQQRLVKCGEAVTLIVTNEHTDLTERQNLTAQLNLLAERITLSGLLATEAYEKGDHQTLSNASALLTQLLSLADMSLPAIEARLGKGAHHG
ncbi:Uncharacterised protein [Pseudomonas luteola]|uniref:Uncharacterized protein n=2 Tax=Pseudomonas TaxID=286 RepID=A0A2X2CE02_PSELU|nr:hypothetical protein SAMN05216409_1276 [Pseudomonas lutea]SPZ05353.1 Uncharacterised protein [Pseudomonas luteola]